MASQDVAQRRARTSPSRTRELALRARYRDDESAEELVDASDLDRRARLAQTERTYRGETGISYDHRSDERGLPLWTPRA